MTGRMQRRLPVLSAIAVVVTAGFLPGAGYGSSAGAMRGPQGIPAGLAAAIHARLGAGAIRPSSAARAAIAPIGPLLGLSVAMSADGTTALVGAPGAAHAKGAAFIFHVSDAGSWTSADTPTATLTNRPGPTKAQLFGLGIALSADGTTAFVGAPLAADGAGRIYVFHVAAEDGWASSSAPAMTLIVPQGLFTGIALAASSDATTLVAGAPYANSFGGEAYVFHASSEDTWDSTAALAGTLKYGAESGSDGGVGQSVAMSGDGTTALISDSYNPNGGDALLYHVSAADAWTSSSTPTAILSDANNNQQYLLGDGVALSGDGTVALLGAPGANSRTGAVDVFHAVGEAAWISTSIPTATLTNAGGAPLDGFGERLAVSTDGLTALVGAGGAHHSRGSGYIFRVADEAAWVSSSTPAATLTDSGGHAGDLLGVSALSADGATALLGAPGVRFQTGAADVFHAADASSWATSSSPTAALTVSALDACVVPRLKGLTLSKAKAALRARSCRLGRVRRVQSRARTGHVVSQSIKPGSRPHVGTKVAVNVAR